MKYFLIFLFVISTTQTSAQTYKRFSVRVALGGLGYPSYRGGSLIQFDPSYRINDKLSVGLRFESFSGSWERRTINLQRTYGMNMHRYFLEGNFRPYVGLGVGLYTPQLLDGGICFCTYSTQENIFGFYPRIGFDYKHFLFALEYNFVSNSQLVVYDSYFGTVTTENMNANYLTLKLGAAIGGGRKK
jgi:hypothetical protein